MSATQLWARMSASERAACALSKVPANHIHLGCSLDQPGIAHEEVQCGLVQFLVARVAVLQAGEAGGTLQILVGPASVRSTRIG